MASDYIDEGVEDDDNDFDIIIVGAGITGLTTAHILLDKKVGLDVLILEANKAIGGRVFLSEESKAFHAHQLQKNITGFLKYFKIQLVNNEKIGVNRAVFLTKSGPLYKLPCKIAAQIYNFLKLIQKISLNFQLRTYSGHEEAKILAKMSLDDFLRNFLFTKIASSICRALISTSCGISDLKKVSVLWYLVMMHGTGGFLQRLKIALGDENRYFLKEGMVKLIEELAKKIKSNQGFIKSSEPVFKIQFNDTRAYVSTNKKCYKCDYVVIAVPPPESSNLIIEPPVSTDLSTTVTLFENGKNVFFTATFEQPFWRDNHNCSGDIVATSDCDSNLRLAFDATHSDNQSRPVLAGFLSEPDSQTLKKFRLFDSLSKFFSINIAENCSVYRERKWMPFNSSDNEDAAIKGGSPMSFLKPCDLTYHLNPLILPHDRVFFAASEYATSWPGTVDGAIEAGKIVASSILWRLRPQSLKRSDLLGFPTSATRFHHTSIEFSIIYYMCLVANICIFWSFLKRAY